MRRKNLGWDWSMDGLYDFSDNLVDTAGDLADTYISVDQAYNAAKGGSSQQQQYQQPTYQPPTSSGIVRTTPVTSKNNTLLYVGIGAVVVLGGIFLLTRKK